MPHIYLTACRISFTGVSRIVFYTAVLLLPVDGLIWGIQMPYWSPFSPALFLLFTLLNARRLPYVVRRFPCMVPMLVLLSLISVYGWLTIGVDWTYLFRTGFAILAMCATLAAFCIAFDPGASSDHGAATEPNTHDSPLLSLHTVVTLLIVAYGVAFLFGVLTWLGQARHLDWGQFMNQVNGVFLRQYHSSRPQFLFAEPSYIGMHLYGVLLPLFWLTRDRRLPVLILTFALGSLAMGSGTRIALDSAVALVVCAIVEVPWRWVFSRTRNIVALAAGAVAGCGVIVALFATQPRLQALASQGLFAGDSSMSARIIRTLAPLEAGLQDIPHLLFGFGAGNIGEAMTRGYESAMRVFLANGGMVTEEIRQLVDPRGPTSNRAGNVFTMNAYTSFITEFGVIAFAAAIGVVLWHVTRNHAWNKTTICWLLLLAYLYLQFEAYAFYALPLFLWVTSTAPQRDIIIRRS
ncbi:hypothetical protein BLEM_1527 [Bifidobacterium lemurum]|uniref:Uncharacterized protein n=1 Tax=Bifidobacterium lemurum TaxID=1603886 RepID=A0A261FQP0_9BIFI|nr:hypothetical protein [Bifidobacterium lemurum]OZG61315.1 hypothetical protein BLEM_1527 [Bifidobacterium lemurum]QOL34703.1 hypothetical protein BL8807_01910 [Bifidobacterium lemurum]